MTFLLGTRRRNANRSALIMEGAFLLLFPGFFFYHTLLGLGLIHAVLGGYFAVIALLVFLPLAWIYVRQAFADQRYFGKTDLYFMLYLLYFAVICLVNAVAGANPAIVGTHVLALVYSIDIFIIFKGIDFDARRFRTLALCSLAAMSAIVFWFSVDGSFYLGALGIAKDPDSVATYQGFSRSYLFTLVPLLAFTDKRRWRVVLYCLAAPTLFVNTARSEFAAALLLIPVIEFYFAKHKVTLFIFSAFLIFLVNANLDLILQQLPSNRTLELLDLSQSTSANLRHHLSEAALRTIVDNPLLGNYASYASGYYAHNILSAWVDLGLFGIVYLLALLFIPAIQLILRGYFNKEKSDQFIFAFALLSITVLLLFGSHYFTDMLIGATLGAYARYRNGHIHGKDRSPDVGPSTQRPAHLHQAMP